MLCPFCFNFVFFLLVFFDFFIFAHNLYIANVLFYGFAHFGTDNRSEWGKDDNFRLEFLNFLLPMQMVHILHLVACLKVDSKFLYTMSSLYWILLHFRFMSVKFCNITFISIINEVGSFFPDWYVTWCFGKLRRRFQIQKNL